MPVTLTVTTARVGRPLRSLAISKDDASAARVASAPKQRCASALESVVYLGHGQTASDPAEVEKEGEGVSSRACFVGDGHLIQLRSNAFVRFIRALRKKRRF